jgi:hypothetical protein
MSNTKIAYTTRNVNKIAMSLKAAVNIGQVKQGLGYIASMVNNEGERWHRELTFMCGRNAWGVEH